MALSFIEWWNALFRYDASPPNEIRSLRSFWTPAFVSFIFCNTLTPSKLVKLVSPSPKQCFSNQTTAMLLINTNSWSCSDRRPCEYMCLFHTFQKTSLLSGSRGNKSRPFFPDVHRQLPWKLIYRNWLYLFQFMKYLPFMGHNIRRPGLKDI